MSKYFLYTFIIFAHSAVICSDFEPNLHKATFLRNNEYFANLTSDQCEIYRPQINVNDNRGYTPIKCAIVLGRPKVTHWLISNGAEVDNSFLKQARIQYNLEFHDLELKNSVQEMETIITMLEAHARWSPARRAWGSAAIRGCLFRKVSQKNKACTYWIIGGARSGKIKYL